MKRKRIRTVQELNRLPRTERHVPKHGADGPAAESAKAFRERTAREEAKRIADKVAPIAAEANAYMQSELAKFADIALTAGVPKEEVDAIVASVKPAPRVEQPRDPLDELETLNTSTQEGNEKALALVKEAHSEECNPLVREWFSLLERTWNFFPTPQQLDAVTAWFRYNGADWKRHNNYNLCRLALVKAGIFPAHMVTDSEREAQMIESLDLSKMTTFERSRKLRSVRQQFAEQQTRERPHITI